MSFLSRKKQLLYISLDGISVIVSWLAAVYLRHGALVPLPPYRTPSTYLIYIAALELIVMSSYAFMKVYRGFYSPIDRVGRATVIVFLLINLISFYFQEYAHSRLVIIMFSALLLLLASSWRIAFFLFMSTSSGKKLFQKRIVIVGTGGDARSLCEQIGILPASPYKLCGLITADSTDQGDLNGIPILGLISDLKTIIREHHIDEIFITQDQVSLPLWRKLIADMNPVGVSVKIVPLRLDEVIASSDFDELRSDLPAIEFLIDPISGWQKLAKRIMDISLATVLLILLSPLFAAISILIKRESEGSVFYFQNRLGRYGEPFRLVKFRTMVHQAEDSTGPVWATRDDERATRLGTKLRRLGLDELPQLFNILRGEMSLVGPRPERPFFAEFYQELTQRRLSVKPGITGLAQVASRYEISVEDKVKYDMFYIQNFSLSLDVTLLLRTVVIIVREELLAIFRRGTAR